MIVFPVAGFLPHAAVHHRRGAHFLVAVFDELLPHVLFDLLPHDPAFGVPEHHAGRLVLHVQQVELPGELAVVALFGLFQAVQIGVEVFLLRPCRAVHALQHLVLRVAAPVGTGQLHQLEVLELAGRRHVRAAAEVDEIALAVQRNSLIGGDRRDDLGLVRLAHVAEEAHRLVARHHAAFDRDVPLRQLGHFFLDRRQVVRRERALVREIVVEAVLDHRADGHLRIGKQRLHRVRQQVRGGMADHVEAVGILVGDDGELRIRIDQMTGIDQFAVDPPGERGPGQTGADAGRDLRHRDRRIELSDGTVGKRDVDHITNSGNKKTRAGRASGFCFSQVCRRTANSHAPG